MSPPTQVAGRYVIERRLGAGGMSTVFQANDTVLERPVAVKLLAEHLADDEAFVARFRREALAAARLQHPNIVQVFDSGKDPTSGRHYIVMEYVDGPSCADLLRERRELDIEETVRAIRDACHGLDYAHRAGVIHRDVKPGNLLHGRGDLDHEARRLRHRQGGRADPHHAGRLGARHGGLPVARAGPRRRGGPGVGHLLARRLRLPVPDRAAAARVRLAHRAGAEAAAGSGRADRRVPARGAARARPGGPPRARAATPATATPPRSTWPRRSRRDCTARAPRSPAGSRDDEPRRDARARRHGRHAGDVGHARRAAERPAAGAPAARRAGGAPPLARGRPPRGRAPALGHLPRAARRAGRVVVVVVLALTSTSGGGVDAPNANDVEQQIQELRDFIQENTR